MVHRMALVGLLATSFLWGQNEKQPSYPWFDFAAARAHEIEPHVRMIPVEGVRPGFLQLHLTLTVSPTGDVTNATATGDRETLKLWPQLEGRIRQWKFVPFEKDGKAIAAEVEEYVNVVPPERLPSNHVAPPALLTDSDVTITLQRGGCFGSCPSYTVSVGTKGIVFNGEGYVVASGKHTDRVDADAVRKLAKRFVDADFYSMEASYVASVTDNPSYLLSIAIDGLTKKIEDYVGWSVGMPFVISELESEVDAFARTARWIEGNDGLVPALQAEKYDFQTWEAQALLKEAASKGRTSTVRGLLEAGVPLMPLLAPKTTAPHRMGLSERKGWLEAGSNHSEVLRLLILSGASKDDQRDKDSRSGVGFKEWGQFGPRHFSGARAGHGHDLGRELHAPASFPG